MEGDRNGERNMRKVRGKDETAHKTEKSDAAEEERERVCMKQF